MQFLLCHIGKEYFALDALLVQKVADRLPVSKLPYVAAYIDGLVNMDGEVIVQLNMPRLLDISANSAGELVIIHVNAYTMALLVDSVVEKISADADDITPFADAGNNHDARINPVCDIHYIQGELVVAGQPYLVLALDKMATLVKPEQYDEGEQGFLALNREQGVRHKEEVLDSLTFAVGNEVLALPLTSVNEIVEIATFTKLPSCPPAIVGIASLRGQPILVLSASALFSGKAAIETNHSTQVIIVPYGRSVVGFLVDRILGISSFNESQFTKEETTGVLVSAYIINQQQRVVLLIDLAALFASSVFSDIANYVPRTRQQEQAKKITTIKLLKVVLANEICAIPVEYIVRLVEYSNSTTIQQSDRGIVGTVDVDGQIIPLLNINKRLNIRNADHFEKLVIIEYANTQWALCINEAQMLFDLDVALIDNSSQRKLVKGIAAHNGELISILDIQYLQSSA